MTRAIVVIAILALLANVGCSSVSQIPVAELDDDDGRVLSVTYLDGRRVEFKKTTVATVTSGTRTREPLSDEVTRYGVYAPLKGTIDGTGLDGRSISVPVDSLTTVSVRRADGTKTTLAVLGISAGLFAAFVAVAIALDPLS